MLCAACGRKLTNDPTKPNAAEWTYASNERTTSYPYCADSADCMRDAEEIAGLR